MKDPEISKLFLAPNYLLPPGAVIDGFDAMKQFAARLRTLTGTVS